MAYQCDGNYDEYVEKLGAVGAVLDELNVTCYAILGDWNVNISNLRTCLWWII